MTTTRQLNVEGMKCNGCKSTVEEALSGVDDVEEVTVSLDEATARVRAKDEVNPQALVAAVQEAGFDADPV